VERINFSKVSPEDVDHFSSIVGPSHVITDPHELEPYNVDWLRLGRGQGPLVLRPETTDEVSKILKHCNERRLAVVPQGGNTGLVGGSNPVFDEIVLSLSRMNKVISLNDTSGILTCEAGCVLESLDNFVGEKGLMMPLDLGAKGSCHIGGNVSTNAGGQRLLRYGSLHGNILGVEAVLADGTVMDCMSEMRKDNTGYDLKQLFIGSEGTLGVVTKVNILLPPKPKSVNVAFLGMNTFDDVKKVYKAARSMLGEIISACEFMEKDALKLVVRNLRGEQPIDDYPFYMLIETSGSNQNHDEEKLSSFLETMLEEEIVVNGTLTTDGAKIQAIWALRDNFGEAYMREGYSYFYDVSLPLDNYFELVEVLKQRLSGKSQVVHGFGHIGDSNLHVTIVSDTHSQELMELIEPFIFDWTAKHRGSISAEHGLGMLKAQYIYHSKSREAVEMMRRIKSLFDPNGILNPYKTIPAK
jgi:FAD/FMN-containing dehydrogenase